MNKKFIVAVAVTLCMWLSVDKIYDFYCSNVPVAKPGECLEVKFSSSQVMKFQVVLNNSATKSSILVRDVDSLYMYYEIDYASLRRYYTKKVSCDEKVN